MQSKLVTTATSDAASTAKRNAESGLATPQPARAGAAFGL